MTDTRVYGDATGEAVRVSAPVGAGDGEPLLPSAGVLLRHAREAAGLHIAALAVALKVPVKKLEALERDRLDLLPDAVFARALAASVCRNLKVDPTPILDRLPQTRLSGLGVNGRREQPAFRSATSVRGQQFMTSFSRPALIAGLTLLFGALVIMFMPNIQSMAALVQTRATGFMALRSPESAPLVLDLTSLPPVRPSPASSEGSPNAENGISVLPAGRQSVAGLAGTRSGSQIEQAASPQSGSILTLSARQESWVKVTDAKGVIVLRRLLAAGEVVAASGALPMEAVIGRADATQVEVRGKILDLAPLSRDNVARFEVK